MGNVVVVGSINVDLVFECDTRPGAGETLVGNEFLIIPGGKGANQAIASAKLGGDVTMIGCIGDDVYANMMMDNFNKYGVDTKCINTVSGSTGVAGIMVDSTDNSIVVVAGANGKVDCEIIDKYKETILSADIVVCQLEIPIETARYLINLCHENGVKTILNPAPMRDDISDIVNLASYVTPNEHEVKELFVNEDIESIIQKYPNKLIITQGKKGVVYHDGEKCVSVPGISVKVKDTTGAGDTFNGALAKNLSDGSGLYEACLYANKVAAISVTKIGAQGGMPTQEIMEEYEVESK